MKRKKKLLKLLKISVVLGLVFSLCNMGGFNAMAEEPIGNENITQENINDEKLDDIDNKDEEGEENKESVDEENQEATKDEIKDETKNIDENDKSEPKVSENKTRGSPEEITLSQTVGGTVIKVTAKAGILPEDTKLEVKKVKKSKVLNAVGKSLDGDVEIKNLVAFDITLKSNGKEIQPDGKVDVTFSKLPFKVDKKTDVKITHVSDNLKKSSEVDVDAQGKNQVSMETNHFSIYAVAEINEKWSPETVNPTTYVPFNSFVYDGKASLAFDFHVFALEADFKNQHTHGNVATDVLYAGTDFGTRGMYRVGKEYNYIGKEAHNITSIASDVVVVGKDVPVKKTSENQMTIGNSQNPMDTSSLKVYKESTSTKYIDIDSELNNLTIISEALARDGASESKETTEGVVYNKSEGVQFIKGSDMNAAMILDVSNCSKTINFFNIKAVDLKEGKSDYPILKVVGAENKTIIINIDMTGANNNTLKNLQSLVDGYGHSEGIVAHNSNVLFNLYQINDNEIQAYETSDNEYTSVGVGRSFLGTVLAPKANITYGQLNGSIIAKKVKNEGGESHKWLYTGLSASIKVNKTLKDPNATTDKTFYFGVFTKDGDEYKRVADQRIRSITLKNDETKSVTFANLKKNAEYYIFETDANGNIINGNFGYSISGQGTQVTIPTDKAQEEVEIVNSTTNKDSVSVNFEIKKSITGIINTNKVFGFELYKTNSNYEIEKLIDEKYTNGNITLANGTTIQFDSISYNTDGIRYYIIKEKALENPEGFSIDNKVYKVKVNVTKDSNDKLHAEVKVVNDDGTESDINQFEFVNNYTRTGTSIIFSGKKYISGINSTDKEFTFELHETDENYTTNSRSLKQSVSTKGTITNSEGQSIMFSEIQYNDPDTYFYVIKEKALNSNNSKGFTTDETEYKIKVVVTEENGQLVKKVYDDKDKLLNSTDQMNFINEYTASGSLNLTATKTVNRKTPNASETFKFSLDCAERNEHFEVENNGEKIEFPSIKYSLKDVRTTPYIYTVK